MRARCITVKLQQRSIGGLMHTPRAQSMFAREGCCPARCRRSCIQDSAVAVSDGDGKMPGLPAPTPTPASLRPAMTTRASKLLKRDSPQAFRNTRSTRTSPPVDVRLSLSISSNGTTVCLFMYLLPDNMYSICCQPSSDVFFTSSGHVFLVMIIMPFSNLKTCQLGSGLL